MEDELHDLALLRISPGTASPLPLSVAQPAIASRIYAIGSPRGYAFSISDGLLSQVHSIDGFPQYQLSCPFSPGNSGGPVLNSAGEVIGVSSWSKIGAQNLNFAIPAQFVSALCATQTPSSTNLPPARAASAPRVTVLEEESSAATGPEMDPLRITVNSSARSPAAALASWSPRRSEPALSSFSCPPTSPIQNRCPQVLR